MGMRAAKEFLFTGRKMFAQEAKEIGLVNRIVPREELESATLALANEIANAPPFALKLVKRSLNRTSEARGFRTSLLAHFDTHQLAHASEEYRAIRAAGLTKTIEKAKAIGGA
jgi:enoyl-CoA hydratase